MRNYYSSQIMLRIRNRLARLYGATADRLLSRWAMMINRYGISIESRPPAPTINQRTCLLITYADTIWKSTGPSLAAMERFLADRLGKAVTHLHILPFCLSSSDDGFSVIHFRTINPQFGQWADLQKLSKSYDLVFDIVMNHVSRRSGWMQDYIAGIAPGRDYFIEADPSNDFSKIVRPRSSPLLTPIQTYTGVKNVWTTFSADQIDLNYANHDVLFEMIDIMMFYIAMGARVLRLDAIAYLWKRSGTTCLNLPETHEVVRLLRDLLALNAPDVRLLTETNLPHAENISYFGNGDEAHWIYQFSLPPLLLHALTKGTARYLAAWAEKLPPPPPGCAYLNITGTHDGIGVRPLEGLVPEPEIAGLADHIVKLGGRVSTRRTASGSDVPYELNTTWFDALGGLADDTPALHMARFLCAQAVLMSLKGIPAVYFNTMIAASNDRALAERTGISRSLNRGKWTVADLDAMLADQASAAYLSLSAHLRILKIRAEHPAFHPDGPQQVTAVTDTVLGIERRSLDGTERILALANVSNQTVQLTSDILQTHGRHTRGTRDILAGHDIVVRDGVLSLEPYAVIWLIIHPCAEING